MDRTMTLLYRLCLPLCLLVALICRPALVQANHVMGGELKYSFVSSSGTNETYQVKLILFADCGSASSTTAFAALPTATPQITVLNNNVFFSTLSLTCDLAQSDIEITPVCPGQQDSTKCTSLTYTIPGVKKFVYTGTVTLTSQSANWRFAFDGQLINSTAGRIAAIGNINTLGGSQAMYLEATLNNTVGTNITTDFTSPPTPFFCINVPQSYALNAIDANGDSLAFSLIAAKVSNTVNAVYFAPYTPLNPLPAVPGSFNFNTTNGLLNFTPNVSMQAVVVDLVEEYRNGVKVGTSMREMTFVILPNCANVAPNAGAITVDNGSLSGNDIKVCQGMIDTLRFGFSATDADGDTLHITYTNLPPGAVATVTNNNTTSPSFSLTWDLSTVPIGNYTFFVTIEDNGCPLSSKQTIGYTVVVEPFQGVLDTGFVAGCRNQDNGYVWIHKPAGDTLDYQFTWKDAAGNIVHTSGGFVAADTFFDAEPGTYTIEVVNEKGCNTIVTETMEAPTYHAAFTVDPDVCVHIGVAFTNTSTPDVTSFVWDFGDGSPLSTAASSTHTYTAPGTYTVRLIGKTGFPCEDTVTTTVTVHEVIVTATPEHTICAGASSQLHAEGALNYTWTPTVGLSCATCPDPIANPTVTTTYVVTGSDAFGCNNTANVKINVVPTNLLRVSPDTAICPGDTAELRATGALAYRWTPDIWLSDTSSATVRAFPTTTTTFTVYGTQQHGCVDTQEVKVTVFPQALLELPDSVHIYPGESYQMDPKGNCLYFQWMPPLGLSGMDISAPLASPPVNTRYFVTAATEAGCRTSDSIDVYVSLESVIDMPNAFTPGSAPNAIFKPSLRGQATLKSFKIFNRWGQTVFETTDINKGWDGQMNGKPQPMGVYVYSIEANTNTGRRFYKQGNVTLLR